MAEYIEREALVAAFRKDAERLGDIDCPWSPAAIEAEIEAMPAADVAPVVHGRRELLAPHQKIWADSKCVNCWSIMLSIDNYYPNCGAKMDLEG